MTSASASLRHNAAETQDRLVGLMPARLSRLGVWRGDDWVQPTESAPKVQTTGHVALDAQLPGGGWPVGAMSEILLPSHMHAEWSLVAAGLGQALKSRPRQRAVLVAPPLDVFTPALQCEGIADAQLCCVQPQNSGFSASRKSSNATTDASSIWVSEQALRCRDVCAVLAWLPVSQAPALRRLQLLAAQQRQLLWVFRPEFARTQASPAPLRLWLVPQEKRLRVRVIKRRGPQLDEPVDLPLLSKPLQAELLAQAERQTQAQADATALLNSIRKPQEVPHASAANALVGVETASQR